VHQGCQLGLREGFFDACCRTDEATPPHERWGELKPGQGPYQMCEQLRGYVIEAFGCGGEECSLELPAESRA
jgi:hypothetical protein